jgi:hypothetical protein
MQQKAQDKPEIVKPHQPFTRIIAQVLLRIQTNQKIPQFHCGIF